MLANASPLPGIRGRFFGLKPNDKPNFWAKAQRQTYFWAQAQRQTFFWAKAQRQTYCQDLLRYVNGSTDVAKYYPGVEAKGI